MAAHCLLGFLALLCYFLLLLSAANEEENHEECPKSFPCPYLGEIHFPFTNMSSECGLAIKGCHNPGADKEVLLGNHTWYRINRIDQKEHYNSISIHDPEFENLLYSRDCSAFNYDANATIIPPGSPMMSLHILKNMTFFRCNKSFNDFQTRANIFKYTDCLDYDIYFQSQYDPPLRIDDELFRACSAIQLPIGPRPISSDPFTFLSSELIIEISLSQPCSECYYARGGQCLLDTENIHCADPYEPPGANATEYKRRVIIVSAALGVGVLIIIIYCFRRRLWFHKLNGLWKDKSKAHQDFEAFLRNHGPLPIRRYSYLEIKKMTNSFAEKLGQGGYGGVFKGKIPDECCLVAVKVLNRSKGNGEEFINEVATISRTSHVNVVTLIGFCFEESKRALIYEFMPNGSLEKFIYGTNPMTVDNQLDCEILYQIAIGVARGLEYLHRGCNARIFHFDIKPHNILLDENFCPKISDFGLAKICPSNESMVSMLAARGTPGYIAPEVFSRNFGVVSHKSDVYSFGMMVLEMVGGRKNINLEVDCTSEIYFPHWIYKRLELNEELALRNISNESDRERMRKMVTVSLWCIQTYPSDRPTMRTVVEMLEGRVETLQIPPNPFLSSPSRSLPHSSTN